MMTLIMMIFLIVIIYASQSANILILFWRIKSIEHVKIFFVFDALTSNSHNMPWIKENEKKMWSVVFDRIFFVIVLSLDNYCT